MVQISTSTVVVAVLAASALAAPAYDAEDMSLSRRNPDPLKVSPTAVKNTISKGVNKLKHAVSGLRGNERKQKQRLANDIQTGNFGDARKAENAIGRDKAAIRNDIGKERVLQTAAADLGRREEYEYEFVRRDPPKTPSTATQSTTPKTKKTKSQRKADRKAVVKSQKAQIDSAVAKEDKVLRGKARQDRQALGKERTDLASAIEKGDFKAIKQDEAAIKKTKADLGTIRNEETMLKDVKNTYGRREFDEYEFEAREFDEFEDELVRRDPPKSVSPPPKTASIATKPVTAKKTKSQRKADRKAVVKSQKAQIDSAVAKEDKVLRGKARQDRQALGKERTDLASAIEKGDFKAIKQDEAAIQRTKADLGTIRNEESMLKDVKNTYGRREIDEYDLEAREFDDEFELEARDFNDEYELEARDFDDYTLEERGFDDYELEMLD